MLVRLGSRGPRVVELQALLNGQRAGDANTRPLELDGRYGPVTLAAVRTFQAAHGLAADGIVGPLTWAALRSSSSLRSPDEALFLERRELLAFVDGQAPPPSVRAALAVAIGYLGTVEEPNGSNAGPVVDRWSSGYFTPADEGRYGRPAWCALFVAGTLLEAAGVEPVIPATGPKDPAWKRTPMGRRIGAVVELRAWAEGAGCYTKREAPAASNNPPRVGDVFVQVYPSADGSPEHGHTGYVLGLDTDPGSRTWVVVTCEGNAGNAVRSHRRPAADLDGWIRLPLA